MINHLSIQSSIYNPSFFFLRWKYEWMDQCFPYNKNEESHNHNHLSTSPTNHTYLLHLNYVSVKLVLYRSNIHAYYPIQTSLFKLLTYIIVVQLLYFTCRSSIHQVKTQPIQSTKLSPIQFLINLEIYKTFHLLYYPTTATQLYLHIS